MTARLLEGDALVRLAELPAASIDVCVTDPPYGLEFMSVAWDTFNDGRKGGERVPNTWGDHGSKEHPRNAYQVGHIAAKKNRAFGEFSQAWATEVLRVLKPGGYLLAFGGTRTYHRLTCAIEDSGFQVRDCLMWLYGSGFPKGKGCLKPGWEPIALARKPGPRPWLNVDGCRIVGPPSIGGSGSNSGNGALGRMNDDGWQSQPRQIDRELTAGRWPANVVLSHEDGCREVGTKQVKGSAPASGPTLTGRSTSASRGVFNGVEATPSYAGPDGTETVASWECTPECTVRLLDEQSGDKPPSYRKSRTTDPAGATWALGRTDGQPFGHHDTGGASRFFYTAKASPSERGAFNDHPTVKPLALMRWLVRLVTPPGGTLIDPFMGSGSTLIAADREGFDAIGIDADPHAVEITRRRLAEDAGPLFSVEAVS